MAKKVSKRIVNAEDRKILCKLHYDLYRHRIVATWLWFDPWFDYHVPLCDECFKKGEHARETRPKYT